MSVAYPQVNTIIIDSVDAEGLARFWALVLGRAVLARTGPYVWLERRAGLGLGFQQVRDAKAGKNRLHFDLSSLRPADEVARIELLGGRRLTDYEAGGFLVMADPEGNEFCVIPTTSFDVDDDGHASY